jgi:hypothetical protein
VEDAGVDERRRAEVQAGAGVDRQRRALPVEERDLEALAARQRDVPHLPRALDRVGEAAAQEGGDRRAAGAGGAAEADALNERGVADVGGGVLLREAGPVEGVAHHRRRGAEPAAGQAGEHHRRLHAVAADEGHHGRAAQAHGAGERGPPGGDRQREREMAVGRQRLRQRADGLGRPLRQRRQDLPEQEQGRRLMAHVAVVAHGERLGVDAEDVDRAARPQGLADAGRDHVGEQTLAAERLRRGHAEPEGVARPVVHGRPGGRAAHVVVRRPAAHGGRHHAGHRPRRAQRVRRRERDPAVQDHPLGGGQVLGPALEHDRPADGVALRDAHAVRLDGRAGVQHHPALQARDEVAGPARADEHRPRRLQARHRPLVGGLHPVVRVEGGQEEGVREVAAGGRAPVDRLDGGVLGAQRLGHEVQAHRRDP